MNRQIAITYRQYDTTRDELKQIVTYLEAQIGKQNMRVIDPNSDILEVIRTVRESDVVLVIMGQRWLNMVDEKGKRLIDDTGDPHHVAIATALEEQVWVSVLLADSATMPKRNDLPRELRDLANRDVITVANDTPIEAQLDTFLSRVQQGQQVTVREVLKKGDPYGRSPKKIADKHVIPYLQNQPYTGAIVFLILCVVVVAGFLIFATNSDTADIEPVIVRTRAAEIPNEVEVTVTIAPTRVIDLESVRQASTDIAPTKTLDFIQSHESLLAISTFTLNNLRPIDLSKDLIGTQFVFTDSADTLFTVNGDALYAYNIEFLSWITEKSTIVDSVIDLEVDEFGNVFLLREGRTFDTVQKVNGYSLHGRSLDTIFTNESKDMVYIDNHLLFSSGDVLNINDDSLADDVTAQLYLPNNMTGNFITHFIRNGEDHILISTDDGLYLNGEFWRDETPNVPPVYVERLDVLLLAKDNQLKQIRVDTGVSRSVTVTGAITHIAIGDGQSIAAIGISDNRVSFFPLLHAFSSPYQTIQVPEGISQIGFSPDNKLFLIATDTSTITAYGMAR